MAAMLPMNNVELRQAVGQCCSMVNYGFVRSAYIFILGMSVAS
jgi:hypothetical protein